MWVLLLLRTRQLWGGADARLGGDTDAETVQRGLDALERLAHRGAEGADRDTGDGAGILLQLPDALFRALVGFRLPPAGPYGVAMCFLPPDPPDDQLAPGDQLESWVADVVRSEGLCVLG